MLVYFIQDGTLSLCIPRLVPGFPYCHELADFQWQDDFSWLFRSAPIWRIIPFSKWLVKGVTRHLQLDLAYLGHLRSPWLVEPRKYV